MNKYFNDQIMHSWEVIGSDGLKYQIEHEKVGYKEVELSLIPLKVKITREDYEFRSRENIHKRLVESYIDKMKHVYGPNRETLIEIHSKLTGSKVNNHFDYLIVLKEILPKLEKLMQ